MNNLIDQNFNSENAFRKVGRLNGNSGNIFDTISEIDRCIENTQG